MDTCAWTAGRERAPGADSGDPQRRGLQAGPCVLSLSRGLSGGSVRRESVGFVKLGLWGEKLQQRQYGNIVRTPRRGAAGTPLRPRPRGPAAESFHPGGQHMALWSPRASQGAECRAHVVIEPTCPRSPQPLSTASSRRPHSRGGRGAESSIPTREDGDLRWNCGTFMTSVTKTAWTRGLFHALNT